MWLVPAKSRGPRSGAVADFAEALRLEAAGEYARAQTILSRPALAEGTLGPYAQYYKGVVQLALDRPAEALTTFRALADRAPIGYLAEATALRARGRRTLSPQSAGQHRDDE